MLRKLRLRLRALLRRDDIGDEIEAHVQQLMDELLAQGLSPHEARIAASRQFGNPTSIQDQSHELFSFGVLTDLARDLGYALRGVRRAPRFFAGSVLVLALGIGANCAVFNLVYSVLLKPMPYERPDELVMVSDGKRHADGSWHPAGTTSQTVLSWRDRSPGVFQDLAVMEMWQNKAAWFDLVLPDRAERLRAGLVTPNFFTVLGVNAILGRTFTPADDVDGRDDLVVLSHGLWQRAFGSDPGVAGRSLTFISGIGKERGPRPCTVVGVLPREFRFTYPQETELWVIHSWKAVEQASPWAIEFNGAVARRAPRVSTAAATARLTETRSGSTSMTVAQPIADWVVGETRPSILLVAAVSVLLLVIACATVANASLVRLAERRRELAVRASLGAGRGRLARQLLAEGLALSLGGTVAGVVLASALLPVFRSLVPGAVPRADEMAVKPVLLLIPAAVATLTTMLALLAPAIQGSQLEVAQTLKNGSGSPTARRWRFAFVALQTTVATALLVGAALLLISFWRLHRVDLGFDGNRVVTAEMRLLDPKYFDKHAAVQFQKEVIEQVRALPGVIEAGTTSAVPFRGVDWLHMIQRIGQGKLYPVNFRQVDPEYFSVMRLQLLRGRLLTDRDTSSTEKVVVLSESAARQMFSGEEPLGKQIEPNEPATIVGIVKDVHYQSMDRAPSPAIYAPRAQNPSELICLVLRTAGRYGSMAAALRRVIHGIDPVVPVMNVTTVDQIVSESVAGRRFYTTTTAAFAMLALLLTASGLIVVIARSVAERRRELAIRSALGAQGRQLIVLVIQQGLMPVTMGTALGLAGAWFGARILSQFLFEVRLHQPAVYAGAGVFTMAVAALACFLPAKGIGEMAPASALQSE